MLVVAQLQVCCHSKVSDLDRLAQNEDILRFDVAMQYPLRSEVMTRRYQLSCEPIDLCMVFLEAVLGNVFGQVALTELEKQVEVFLALLDS